MEFSLQEKIEALRREPEHVRRRYVLISVSFSMILIIGIWLLSVQDSVTTAANSLPEALEQGRELTGGAPSLNELFQGSSPLRLEEKPINGSEFFNQQMNGGTGMPTQ